MEHHLIEFHDKKIKHCICSDDILLFERTPSEEYENYAKILGLGEKECYMHAKETCEYVFGKGEGEFLREKFGEFEQKNREEFPFLIQSS